MLLAKVQILTQKHLNCWNLENNDFGFKVPTSTKPICAHVQKYTVIINKNYCILHVYFSVKSVFFFHFPIDFFDEKSYEVSQIRNAGRQNVLRLVLHSLQHPSPNLAYFLMGYELRKPVSKTNLQDPGTK